MNYLVVKAVHIIAIICWMAALLYLPRLFVYHSSRTDNEEVNNLFCLMEKKLIRIIMNPSMIISVISGSLMIYIDMSYLTFWWMHLKLLAILMMLGTHKYFIAVHRSFVGGSNTKSEIFFRKINEVPTILMIIIVFLIVLKP